MALPSATDVEQIGSGSSGGLTVGGSTSEKVSFYGVTPVTQRAAAAQDTTTVGTASSTDITSNVKAAIIEIMNTLKAIGAWKGSA